MGCNKTHVVQTTVHSLSCLSVVHDVKKRLNLPQKKLFSSVEVMELTSRRRVESCDAFFPPLFLRTHLFILLFRKS